MYCLDTSFLIDLANNDPRAVRKYREIAGVRLYVSTIAVFEFLSGKFIKSDEEQQALRLISTLDTLDFSAHDAMEAAELRKTLASTGGMISNMDLLIGTTAKANRLKLVTRDKDFRKIPGLEVEEY